MGWRMGKEGGKPHLTSPSIRNTGCTKQQNKLIKKSSANKAESSIHACLNNSPWAVLCGLTGWDGHVHSGWLCRSTSFGGNVQINTSHGPPPTSHHFFIF